MKVNDSAAKAAGLRNRGKLQKVVETGALVFSWIAMGMYVEIPGPTLIDLKFRLNTGYEELATALAARGFGTFPGCLVGGFLVDKFSGWSHLMVALTLCIAAVDVVLMPWVPNLQYMWILCFISGIVQSIHNTGVAAASMSVAYFAFQLIENKHINKARGRDMSEDIKVEKENSNKTAVQKEKQIEATESELNMKLKDRKIDQLKSMLQMINPASCAKGRLWYGFGILFLMFFHFGNAGGGQQVISQFVRSFSIDQLKFSSADGTLINTSYWISFSIGRFLFFIMAKWISVKVLIFVQTLGAMCSAMAMAIFADDNSIAFWLLIHPVGFFWGPLWPTGVAWTDYHMELTGMGMASQMLGASVFSIVHMRLIGYLYDNIGPITYLYHVAGSAVFGFLLAVALDIIGARHGNRFVPDTQDCKEEQNENKDGQTSRDTSIVTKL